MTHTKQCFVSFKDYLATFPDLHLTAAQVLDLNPINWVEDTCKLSNGIRERSY